MQPPCRARGSAGVIRLARLAALICCALACVASSADAATWAIQTLPESGGTAETLSTTSCPSERFCMAVGQLNGEIRVREIFEIIIREAPLAETWNGSSWTLQAPLTPRWDERSSFSGVSCTSESFCVAVGRATTVALIERWNGSEWAIQEAPVPAEASGPGSFASVSCVSSSECTAVGSYVDRSTGSGHLYIVHWNGREWSLQTPPAAFGGLRSVTCSSSTACAAVSTTALLVVLWDGRTWTQRELPRPSERANHLLGISCTSATSCIAVGEWEAGGGTTTALSELLEGSTWTVQTPATPREARSTRLEAAACSSTTARTAVGAYKEALGTQLTLAESWNGRAWTVQATPNPREARTAYLRGVSCSTALLCSAAGIFEAGAGSRALLERYS